jgi:hypothetical protein
MKSSKNSGEISSKISGRAKAVVIERLPIGNDLPID